MVIQLKQCKASFMLIVMLTWYFRLTPLLLTLYSLCKSPKPSFTPPAHTILCCIPPITFTAPHLANLASGCIWQNLHTDKGRKFFMSTHSVKKSVPSLSIFKLKALRVLLDHTLGPSPVGAFFGGLGALIVIFAMAKQIRKTAKQVIIQSYRNPTSAATPPCTVPGPPRTCVWRPATPPGSWSSATPCGTLSCSQASAWRCWTSSSRRSCLQSPRLAAITPLLFISRCHSPAKSDPPSPHTGGSQVVWEVGRVGGGSSGGCSQVRQISGRRLAILLYATCK